jgi:hypothetical protein
VTPYPFLPDLENAASEKCKPRDPEKIRIKKYFSLYIVVFVVMAHR